MHFWCYGLQKKACRVGNLNKKKLRTWKQETVCIFQVLQETNIYRKALESVTWHNYEAIYHTEHVFVIFVGCALQNFPFSVQFPMAVVVGSWAKGTQCFGKKSVAVFCLVWAGYSILHFAGPHQKGGGKFLYKNVIARKTEAAIPANIASISCGLHWQSHYWIGVSQTATVETSNFINCYLCTVRKLQFSLFFDHIYRPGARLICLISAWFHYYIHNRGPCAGYQ